MLTIVDVARRDAYMRVVVVEPDERDLLKLIGDGRAELKHESITCPPKPYFFLTSTKADEDIVQSCKPFTTFITTKVSAILL